MHNMCNYAAPRQQMDGRQKAQSPHPDPSPKLGAPSKVSSAYRFRMSLLRRHPESDAEAATGAEAIRRSTGLFCAWQTGAQSFLISSKKLPFAKFVVFVASLFL